MTLPVFVMQYDHFDQDSLRYGDIEEYFVIETNERTNDFEAHSRARLHTEGTPLMLECVHNS